MGDGHVHAPALDEQDNKKIHSTPLQPIPHHNTLDRQPRKSERDLTPHGEGACVAACDSSDSDVLMG